MGGLCHHGDFDRAGLAITRRMVERHGASPWDPDLAEAMRRRGHALFEETVAHTLLKDLGTKAR